MRIGVTGLDGFTGVYLARVLAEGGHEALSLATEITDAAAVDRAVEAMKPDAVVHLAGRAFVDSADFASFYAVNQVGTFHLLDALARHVPHISVLLASSAQVYGPEAAGLVTEDAPLAPNNHYALSKAAMEIGSRLWSDRLTITIARPFNYTGVGQQGRYVIPKIVDAFRRRAPVLTLGNIDVERDFGDVRSVVDSYRGLIEAGSSGVVNISTGTIASVRSIIARLSAMTGHQPRIETDASLIRSGDVAKLGGDNRRLRHLLPDWSPRSFDDTLEWMLTD